MPKPHQGYEIWDAAIALLVDGLSKTKVAEQLKINRDTLNQWWKDDRFQIQYKAAEKAYFQKRGKQVVKRLTMPGDSEEALPDNAQDIGKTMRRIARGS